MGGRRWLRQALLVCAAVCGVSVPVQAQTAGTLPEPLRGVGIDQRLDGQVPLDLVFRDETGKAVRLGEYIGAAPGRPTILALVYYECPMLCSLVLNGLLGSLKALSFTVGDEFNIVTVSFDPRETPALAAAKKKEYVRRYGRPGAAAGWHFLTGEEEAIRQLARAVGFRYAYDAKTDQYIHASGIMVVTPRGRLARYFYGIEYAPRDVRLGLVEASANRIGSPIDQVLLFCYHYDPVTGKYGLLIMNVLRLAGLATVLALGTFIAVMLRRDRRRKRDHGERSFRPELGGG
ncbi:MAG: SCO family protein [Thermodesulfobacteriota bacterium]